MQKIIIHSVPRSGSTWLGTIFNSHSDVVYKYQPLFSYAFKGFIDQNSSKEKIEEFFKKIENSNDEFINQKEDIEKGIVPEFLKSEMQSHICYKEVRYHHILNNLLSKCNDVKVILLVRNPLAVLYSWKNAPKEFKKEKGWVFDNEWLKAPSKNLNRIEEYNGYYKWKEVTSLFFKLKKEYPNNVKLITYSDLLINTKNVVKELFEFSNLKFSEQTENFIKISKSKNVDDSYSVFKIKKQDSKWEKLPNHIIEYIYNDLLESPLKVFLND